MSHSPLNRRQFLGSLGAGTSLFGYSLIIDAREFAAPLDLEQQDIDGIRAAMDALGKTATVEERLAAEPHMRVVPLACDFLVAGGGMAGVCAALAAARHGARVILVQDRSRLGGNASSEVRMHIVGADHSGSRPGWREGGILEELRLEYAALNPHNAWEMWDLLLYDKIVSEPNITLLLDSAVFGATVESDQIREVLVRCDKTEHLYRIQAPLFADCTGDCRLGLEAGAEMRTGHEGFSDYLETLAPEVGGPATLGSSLLFTSKDYGRPMPFTPPAWARKVTKEHLKHRGTRSWEYGYWWIEWGGQHDAIRDNERIRFELLSIVLGVWDYIKNSGEYPESATWAMDWIGMIPGKRASRRLDGPYLLTQADLENKRDPKEDAVAIGGWPFDNHPPSGFDDPDTPPSTSIRVEEVFNIPLRCLYSKNIANLFMAGRNISASHVAFTSTRVMATCSVEGQAIGTAAAQCVQAGILPQALYDDKARLKLLQQTLLRDDQTIRGLLNEDEQDLARSAGVVASASVEGSRPENILTGWTRDETGEWQHRWGGPLDADGAWIELQWEAPQKIAQVQLVFDSGFHRPLTLTEQAGYQARMHSGPQPETVRDYRVEYRGSDGSYVRVADVTGNYQRLRRHRFAPVETDRIRLTVTATNGNPEARVFEIRCY
ncbi:MAG: FAD-dependent oxidoreductase [Candidatus Hydrogenedentes bacterium]|nr:FAD-dependent oxidoreductase [Candidatus Hydrogenedentota bacterium]